MSLPVYQGRFGTAQAERLLWRAGFGPRPGEAQKLARKGLKRAVLSLTRPKGKAKLRGPTPRDDDGLPLAPADAWGHDLLWWLDRMVRSDQPLVERMALSWHDWFATADVGQAQLNLDQNQLFRRRALGSFADLLADVTVDPAMLIWLSGNENTAEGPNENYAREMMELFTLGAGNGYTETDVREQARALTGWTNDWDEDLGSVNFRFDQELHDTGTKRIFGKSGNYDWRDSCRLCLEHPAHAGYFVTKLWSYFIPKPPSKKTLRDLKKLYKRRKYAIRPVVEAILLHPELHTGPRMVKPPIVQIAGMLRGRKSGITTDAWTWIADDAGQRLFRPPNVSGWDETRWLDTARLGGRWTAAGQSTDLDSADDDDYDAKETPKQALEAALRFWGKPTVSDRTRRELLQFCSRVEKVATEEWQQQSYRALRQNALRILIASSPDYMTA
ncbi:MAG: DUF1800 domain-containing protein [Solirubrobacterales bacterium]|nr:DUF1800 domain-containing protein [Solirubrobacterales bacterium]MCB8969602.1 DUF1800 domain-containing protein [Thermoleophilales bacterium]